MSLQPCYNCDTLLCPYLFSRATTGGRSSIAGVSAGSVGALPATVVTAALGNVSKPSAETAQVENIALPALMV